MNTFLSLIPGTGLYPWFLWNQIKWASSECGLLAQTWGTLCSLLPPQSSLNWEVVCRWGSQSRISKGKCRAHAEFEFRWTASNLNWEALQSSSLDFIGQGVGKEGGQDWRAPQPSLLIQKGNLLLCKLSLVKILQQRGKMRGWGDGSAVKSSYYSCRGQKFGSHNQQLKIASNSSPRGSNTGF